jgi:hypothetical protein
MTEEQMKMLAKRINRLEEFVLSIVTHNPSLRINLPDYDTTESINELAEEIERYGDTGQL